jgi:hypothetical protein
MGIFAWLSASAGVLCAAPAVQSVERSAAVGAQDPIGPPAPGADPVPLEPAPASRPVPLGPPSTRYRSVGDLEELLRGWLRSGGAERVKIGNSAGGRPLVGIVFGRAGGRPLEERATVLLVGGLDGVSLSGCEAVIRVADELLAAPERLPAEVAFLAIPFANPDGLTRELASSTGDGRNDTPTDDDGDGRVDEDGPDAVDDDGAITCLLIEAPDGPWARAADDRLLAPARPGDAPRYCLAREGKDDDGDGRFNEDGPGGIVPDLDFPVDWRGPWTGAPAGPWPLASPEARALADLVEARRIALALCFQGSHGRLATPGGLAFPDPVDREAGSAGTPILEADAVAFELAARRFARATGRTELPPVRLCEARGVERPGAALDWLYLARGVLALEVAAWGPWTGPDGRPAGPFGTGFDDLRGSGRQADLLPRVAQELERAFARWVDDTRGGIGFLDWQPIELGASRAGLIGGWLPRTRTNPPDELLPGVVSGLGDFVRDLAADLPRLEIEVLEFTRCGGDVCVLRARVRNRGALPTGVAVAEGPLGARFSLAASEGVRILVGEEEHALGHIAGGGASPEVSWVLSIPESGVLTLSAAAPWLAPVEREVRP